MPDNPLFVDALLGKYVEKSAAILYQAWILGKF